MEIAWATNEEVMNHGEGVVRHIASTLLDERSEELQSLGRDLEPSDDMLIHRSQNALR